MPLSVTLRRLGYRLAYRILQVIWLLTRPEKHGVKCLLTDGDRILLVRHTYGSRAWDLPGGGLKRGEPPLSAARREMQEELGVDPLRWTDLGAVQTSSEHRHDTIHVFAAELSSPVITIDRGEIATAQWFDRARLPALAPLGAHVLHTLAADPGRHARSV